MHSHLLPGIDDGVEDLQSSLQLIGHLHDLGYRKLITTPHTMWDMYKNTRETIEKGAAMVNNLLSLHRINMAFSAASEYFTDEHFEEMLRKDEPLLTLKDRMVLVEFSFLSQPIELKKILFNMQIKGYQPVIAHPERYMYFHNHRHQYNEMKEIGCMFQLNMLSLGGHYGRPAAEVANYLIRKKYVDLLGTDLHNARHLKLMQHSSAEIMDGVHRLLDSGMLQNAQL
jgi:tyrosine-protein phosphatase YwqE